MSDRYLDLKGLKCPLPALRTRKALLALEPGGSLHVVCTDPLAAIDIPNLVRESGDIIDERSLEGDVIAFRIRRAAAAPPERPG